MKGLRAFVLQYQPIVALVVMGGMFALTAVGTQFLDDQHAPVWLKWMIGVPFVAFMGFVGMVLAGGDVDNEAD